MKIHQVNDYLYMFSQNFKIFFSFKFMIQSSVSFEERYHLSFTSYTKLIEYLTYHLFIWQQWHNLQHLRKHTNNGHFHVPHFFKTCANYRWHGLVSITFHILVKGSKIRKRKSLIWIFGTGRDLKILLKFHVNLTDV